MSTPTTRVAFHTMGCKTNFSETSTISSEMMAHGLQQVSFKDKADVYVLNSCSVTENADKEARKLIRQARRRNPDAAVAVIGCYAQLQPTEIAAIPGVELVVGAAEKFNLFNQCFFISLKLLIFLFQLFDVPGISAFNLGVIRLSFCLLSALAHILKLLYYYKLIFNY